MYFWTGTDSLREVVKSLSNCLDVMAFVCNHRLKASVSHQVWWHPKG